MRTTLLNPTVWLLVATVAAGVHGAWRGRDARASAGLVLRYASAWPVLLALLAAAGAGLGSRAVLGYLSPGAYAEEVVAARGFLEQRGLYGVESRSDVTQWMGGAGAQETPWGSLPGITPCQANALANRARFYTEHAHTPMLLLAGVPVVYAVGGRGLYVLFVLLSLGAVLAMSGVLIHRAGLPWRSRSAALLLAAIAGWQPVLAGIRQGDAVLVAAGLVALAWYQAARGRGRGGGIAGGLAGCLAVPAIGVLPALVRSAPRAAALAAGVLLVAIGSTMALAGGAVVPGFMQTVAETATTYAAAPSNYGVAGRLLAAVDGLPVDGRALLLIGLTIVVLCSWWRARNVDTAFAAFTTIGLLVAPVVWSQHLSLVLIPSAVLFIRIARDGSSLRLSAWALLVLFFSLPDTATMRFGLPLVPLALVLLWAWTAFGRASVPPLAAPSAATMVPVSH